MSAAHQHYENHSQPFGRVNEEPEVQKVTEKSVWRDGDGVERSEDRRAARPLAAIGRWRKMGKSRLMALHWYAVLARGKHEAHVEALLERRGFVAVVPKWRLLRRANRYAKRSIEVLKPVAPGYVLVGFRGHELRYGAPPWHKVFDITMVSSVLGLEDDGRAWRLRSEQVVGFLLDNEVRVEGEPDAQDEQVTVSPVPPDLTEGSVVTVTHGPWTGHAGPVVRMGDGETVTLMMRLFGREAEVEFSRSWVEATDGA